MKVDKKYYLVKFDSHEDYYKCMKLYKAESKEILKKHLEKTMASDMYIKSIEQVDYENNKKEVLKQVSSECKFYRDYKEI